MIYCYVYTHKIYDSGRWSVCDINILLISPACSLGSSSDIPQGTNLFLALGLSHTCAPSALITKLITFCYRKWIPSLKINPEIWLLSALCGFHFPKVSSRLFHMVNSGFQRTERKASPNAQALFTSLYITLITTYWLKQTALPSLGPRARDTGSNP